jgi:predicted metal-dependent hydrolase
LSRSDWIQQNQSPPPTTLRHGHQLGKAHRLVFEARPTKSIATRISLTEVRVFHPLALTPDHPDVQRRAQSASLRALKQEAQQVLPGRLRTLATTHDFTFGNVAVKQLKSRWGSCNSMQDITLNIFLMQLPWHLIDYVLLHELTHTRIMQHGQPFWNELQKHLPSAKAMRREINTYQPLLTPYD